MTVSRAQIRVCAASKRMLSGVSLGSNAHISAHLDRSRHLCDLLRSLSAVSACIFPVCKHGDIAVRRKCACQPARARRPCCIRRLARCDRLHRARGMGQHGVARGRLDRRAGTLGLKPCRGLVFAARFGQIHQDGALFSHFDVLIEATEFGDVLMTSGPLLNSIYFSYSFLLQ